MGRGCEEVPRRRRVALLVAVATVPALALTACSDGTPGAAPSRHDVPDARVTPVSPPKGSPAARRQDGCARIISALGYADQVLLGAGREREQRFDEGVRGRLAYVAGTVEMFARAVPPAVTVHAAAVGRDAAAMTAASTPQAEQVERLLRYRADADALVNACRGGRPGR
jgi:hypothetical protein